MKQINNYLKVFRKQSGLSQKDVAFIINKPSVCSISKLENNQIVPDLKTVIYLSLVYQKRIKNIFPKLYESCQQDVLENSSRLSGKYHRSDRKKDEMKMTFLEKIMQNIVKNNARNYEFSK